MADVVKYGIQIPNRVFVGGVAFDTKEEELKEFFSKYGKIKECKIVKDNQSISRGFAFVTFECKHDAIQTQQLGTVFFKQKKLNLGPAIRQKGVVFNGAKEAENEPVLSTGVYIHPSGYSYTVAPNGVWYFHNSDGTPPSVTPGTPPMAYTPNIVQKTQNHARRSSTGSSTCGSVSPPALNDSSPPMVLPMFHGAPPSELTQISVPQVMQVPTPYQESGYVSNQAQYGAPNIHVAFQNMSISSHGAAMNPVHHMAPAGPGHHPMQYTRMTEMYVPYYPHDGKVVTSCGRTQPRHMNEHYLPKCTVAKPDFHTMMTPAVSHVKDAYMYPYCTEPAGPTYIYPQHHHKPSTVLINEVQPGMYKKFVTKPMYIKSMDVVGCSHDYNGTASTTLTTVR